MRENQLSRITQHASFTTSLLILLILAITAVTACNATPTPGPTLATTTAALLPPPTLIPTQSPSVTPSSEAYPVAIVPIATAVTTPLAAYLAPETAVPLPTMTAQETAVFSEMNTYTYLPLITQDENSATADNLAEIADLTPTPMPTIDFAAIQAELLIQGQDIAYTKIGFHTGVGGNSEGLDVWMRDLDAAGMPFFLKSADNAEPIYIAQEMMRKSGVPHTLVYRKVAGGDFVSVPNYDLPAEVAAQQHWQLHTEAFPPELDPSLVWMETMNEVDKERHEWLAQFALTTAQLALRDGYKWAAFGWASGEPEPEMWQTPTMLELLRLMGEHPDQLAIAVHEYSYVQDEIGHGYPYKLGRFLELFRIADAYGIPRPTVLITEWGWTYDNVPEPADALIDINWASRLYAPYPEVKGAAIWYLGYSHNDLPDQTQRLIEPVTEYSLTHYFTAPISPNQAATDPDQYPPPNR